LDASNKAAAIKERFRRYLEFYAVSPQADFAAAMANDA
jgi:hypothetical protein